MELQQPGSILRCNSYNLSSGKTAGFFSLMKRRENAKICIIAVLVLLVAIGFFLVGFYSGKETAAGAQVTNMDDPDIMEVRYVEWIGVCPNKTSTCPESYQGIPPLILISLDGFRPDYLQRNFTPTLTKIAQCGTNVPYMYPVFPSKTYPNHYSIVTGLYPESHGVIDNDMYDPDKRETFKIGKAGYLNPDWYEAEPIWVTAQKQGKRSATFYWAGSEVLINGTRPNDYRIYKDDFSFEKRADAVLGWLDRPKETRPDFITLYVYQPDKAGHRFGILSQQVDEQLFKVDTMITRLFSGLQQRNLLNCVNVIILSDHGMVDSTCNHSIKLQNYINVSEVYSILHASGRINPKDKQNETAVEALISSLQCKNEHMRVYQKCQLPVRYHYSYHKRIEPIFLDLDNRYTLTDQDNIKYCEGGVHGYDNYFQDMTALFMAYGPSFKFNNTLKPFLNIELYELMTELLNITANPNNGTKGSLHDLLQEPELLLNQTEPVSPSVGLLPDSEKELELRIYAAYCTCTENGTTEQLEVKNMTMIDDQHVPFGIPITHELNQSHLLLYNNDYVAVYDPKYRLPMWSSFTVSKTVAVKEVSPCWQGDGRISFKDTPECLNYNETIIQSQGILQRPLFPLSFATPSSLHEASLVTNSVPKHENHVTLIEQNFEKLVSLLVHIKGSLNVIAGPAFDVLGTGVYPGIALIMQTHMKYGPLIMPTHYFYVITWCVTHDVPIQSCLPSDLEVAAFLLPNIPLAYNCESPFDLIRKHMARVIDVETLAGMSFFTKLPIYDAIRLKTSVPTLPKTYFKGVKPILHQNLFKSSCS